MLSKEQLQEIETTLQEIKVLIKELHQENNQLKYFCGQQRLTLEKAKETLKDISNSPMWVETVPKDGIDKCPEQVILNANIGLIKMKKVNEILEEIEKLGVGE